MTYRKLTIIAIACTILGAATILMLALGSNAGDDHPGGSCGYLAPNPPEPAPDEEPGSTSGAADGSGTSG